MPKQNSPRSPKTPKSSQTKKKYGLRSANRKPKQDKSIYFEARAKSPQTLSNLPKSKNLYKKVLSNKTNVEPEPLVEKTAPASPISPISENLESENKVIFNFSPPFGFKSPRSPKRLDDDDDDDDVMSDSENNNSGDDLKTGDSSSLDLDSHIKLNEDESSEEQSINDTSIFKSPSNKTNLLRKSIFNKDTNLFQNAANLISESGTNYTDVTTSDTGTVDIMRALVDTVLNDKGDNDSESGFSRVSVKSMGKVSLLPSAGPLDVDGEVNYNVGDIKLVDKSSVNLGQGDMIKNDGGNVKKVDTLFQSDDIKESISKENDIPQDTKPTIQNTTNENIQENENSIPPRPAYKQSLINLLRSKFSNSKNLILTTNDFGLLSSEPIALKINNLQNQVIISNPIKHRLSNIAKQMALSSCSILVHCIIFLISFWTINLFTTFYFPSSEDQKVNYFYEILTWQNAGSLKVHAKHYERWLVWPEFKPEILALFFTIFISTRLSKIFNKQNENVDRIPLLKLC